MLAIRGKIAIYCDLVFNRLRIISYTNYMATCKTDAAFYCSVVAPGSIFPSLRPASEAATTGVVLSLKATTSLPEAAGAATAHFSNAKASWLSNLKVINWVPVTVSHCAIFGELSCCLA